MKNQFSVIIPVYNNVYTLKRAIDSIYSQGSYIKEIIVIDDNSTKNIESIVGETCATYVKLPANMGVATARNKGLELAKSKYVCFLDSDDYWKPGFINEIKRLIEAAPGCAIYSVGHERLTEEGFKQPFLNITNYTILTQSSFLKFYKKNKGGLNSSTICINKNILSELKLFPDGYDLGEDIFVWLKISIKDKICISSKRLSIISRDTVSTVEPKMWKNPPAYLTLINEIGFPKSNYKIKNELHDTILHLFARQSLTLASSGQKKLIIKGLSFLRYNSLLKYNFWLIITLLFVPQKVVKLVLRYFK